MKPTDTLLDAQNCPELSEIKSLIEKATSVYNAFQVSRELDDLKPFDECCQKLNVILKKFALTNDLGRIAELDTNFVNFTGFISQSDMAKFFRRELKNPEDVTKQLDCFKTIKRSSITYATYESYINLIQSCVPGVGNQFEKGLPIDGTHIAVKTLIKTLQEMLFATGLSKGYYALLNTRNIIFNRIGALHEQKQIAFMDRYVKEFPNDSQSEAFLKKRDELVKNVTEMLEKTSAALSSTTESEEN